MAGAAVHQGRLVRDAVEVQFEHVLRHPGTVLSESWSRQRGAVRKTTPLSLIIRRIPSRRIPPDRGSRQIPSGSDRLRAGLGVGPAVIR
ncbi:hypothetical protein GCM10010269_70740 [Streptomyces humidus]|uniref:Uncharacterized protein n=1 Tax=Streptomyces humidus TaxID=52259 RepID=A0A918G7N8_9ACTN|nr:hypothetical protein GCM10010269_70740 [Streptomyces humidus]